MFRIIYNSISNGMFSYIFAFGSSAIVDCCPSIGSFGETTKGIANVVRESSRRTQGYIANCVKYYINLRIASTTEETINAIIKSILMVLDV